MVTFLGVNGHAFEAEEPTSSPSSWLCWRRFQSRPSPTGFGSVVQRVGELGSLNDWRSAAAFASLSADAVGCSALLRPRGSVCCVQCFRCDVGAVGPDHGATFDKEPAKIARGLQRLEYRAIQPGFKIDCRFGLIVEHQMNGEAAAMFGSDNSRKNAHERSYSKGAILLEWLADLHLRPVPLELANVMKRRPLTNEPERLSST